MFRASMKNILFNSTSALAVFGCSYAMAAEQFDWGYILQGDNIRVGVNLFGTFGNGDEYGSGILFDPTGTSSFNHSFDFLAPGSPYDAFSLGSAGRILIDNNNDEWYTGQNVVGSLQDLSGQTFRGSSFDNRVLWSFTNDDLSIEHDYFFNNADLAVNIRTTITAFTDLAGLFFARAVDPDAVVEEGDGNTTRNFFGSEDGFKFVFGEALASKYLLGLLTNGAGTLSTIVRINNSWGFSAGTGPEYGSVPEIELPYYGLDPEQLFNTPDDSRVFNDSATESDDIIALAFSLGDLQAGEAISFLYSYVFGSDIRSSIEALKQLLTTGISAEGTFQSLVTAAQTTDIVTNRIVSAATRLNHQELSPQVQQRISGFALSTRSGIALPSPETNSAVRVGVSKGGNSRTGELAVGTISAAHAVTPSLTFGGSFERSEQKFVENGYSAESKLSLGSIYLRSKPTSENGFTYKIAYAHGRGEMSISRSADAVESEPGAGNANITLNQASVEVGYRWQVSDDSMILPFFRITNTKLKRDSYSEGEDLSFPLTYAESTFKQSTLSIGVDTNVTLSPNLDLGLGIGVEHDLSISGRGLSGSSSLVGLDNFIVDGLNTEDKTRLYVAANLRHTFKNGSSMLLTGRISEDAFSNSVFANMGLNYEVRF